MFYPVDSLKRGGKFYLCWVADSWPLRFASITNRQLWSQDIRKICDDLIEVVKNESGRPTNRFSLRLSSQLMRGLVRLYEKKVNLCLNEMCMLNANVFKHANKKYNIYMEDSDHERPEIERQVLIQPQVIIQEQLENEPRVVELIQNSGNVVANIQDITLKEAAIPEFQLPPNDGFGEENPEHALQLLADRTMEMMMFPTDTSAAQHSGLDLAGLDLTDKSHDRSRLVLPDRQMERVSEHDLSAFRQSHGGDLLPGPDFEKVAPEIPDVLIPDVQIPEVPNPELPIHQEILVQQREPEPPVDISEKVVEPQKDDTPIPQVPTEKRRKPPTVRQSDQIELEDLEETESRPKRRRIHRKLIIDKNIKLSAKVLRARTENQFVELRCETSTEDIIDIQVPNDVFMRRPCHAGYKVNSNASQILTRMFMRNLGVVNKPTRIERDAEECVMHRTLRSHTRSTLERIDEEIEPTVQVNPPQTEELQETTLPINQEILAPQDVDISKDLAKVVDQDITEVLTQKIETLSQQERKRLSAIEGVLSPKRWRSFGYVTFSESQRKQPEMDITIPVEVEVQVHPKPRSDEETDKENVPTNRQTSARRSQDSVTAMLQEAGLADVTHKPTEPEQATTTQRKTRQESERSETPLGSLDRTKVSLGESDVTTESKKIIRDKWGTHGTMFLILKCIKEAKQAITVSTLLEKGQVLAGYKRIIAARCFNSILRLKQHGFIKIQKDPDTCEIVDITLGPKFN